MSNTSPQPNVGADDEKERIRRVISKRGLVGAANDVKWGVYSTQCGNEQVASIVSIQMR